MKFIIGKKVYDTEKAEVICEYQGKEKNNLFPNLLNTTELTLYKSKKGNWFEVKKVYDRYSCKVVDDDYIKKLFRFLNAVELFNKYFEDELEEA